MEEEKLGAVTIGVRLALPCGRVKIWNLEAELVDFFGVLKWKMGNGKLKLEWIGEVGNRSWEKP